MTDRTVTQAQKYRREMAGRMKEPARLALAVRRYTVSRMEMAGVVDAARRASDEVGGIKLKDRQHLANMVRRLYGMSRRLPQEDWIEAFATTAAGWIADGVGEESLLAALQAVWKKLVSKPTDEDLARLVQLARAGGGARMKDKVRSQSAECRSQNAEAGSVKRKASSVKRRASSASIDKPSPLEVFTWNRAQEQLRFALAGLDPIVKRCVSFRLLRRDSFKKLAEELEVSLDDVREILACLRGRVHKYTTYFDRDWYWDESAKRFTLPEPSRG